MTTHAEFNDYPLADLPAMPEGFADSSWHNDTCPSYIDEQRGLRIFIDYVDVTKRELSDGPRFTLLEEETNEVIYTGDDWNKVLERIAQRDEI
jgi:hypothetical protein